MKRRLPKTFKELNHLLSEKYYEGVNYGKTLEVTAHKQDLQSLQSRMKKYDEQTESTKARNQALSGLGQIAYAIAEALKSHGGQL